MTDVRQPTLEEAVHIVMQARSRDYRRTCLKYWTERYGEQYTESVRREVMKRWEGKARKKRVDSSPTPI